jgi:hypothetical protein
LLSCPRERSKSSSMTSANKALASISPSEMIIHKTRRFYKSRIWEWHLQLQAQKHSRISLTWILPKEALRASSPQPSGAAWSPFALQSLKHQTLNKSTFHQTLNHKQINFHQTLSKSTSSAGTLIHLTVLSQR